MDTNKRDYVRGLVMALAPVFKQDEEMARGKYKAFVVSKPATPCAPHTYHLDRSGIWVCQCGQILPKEKC